MSEHRSSSQPQSGLFNLPTGLPAGLLAVAGLFAAWYTHTARLETGRPAASLTSSPAHDGEQSVPARLWQDPFQAVSAGAKPTTNPAGERDFHVLAGQIRRKLDDNRKVLLLPVMVNTDPYPEDQEWRLRLRYATLSALTSAAYVPEDAAHIGVVTVAVPTQQQLAAEIKGEMRAEDGGTLVVPYEWFKHENIRTAMASDESRKLLPRPDLADDVLVLWLDDKRFEDHPATRMARLVLAIEHSTADADERPRTTRLALAIARRLREAGVPAPVASLVVAIERCWHRAIDPGQHDGSRDGTPHPLRVSVLGPDSSTVLRGMALDPSLNKHPLTTLTDHPAIRRRLPTINWRCTHATVPSSFFLLDERLDARKGSTSVGPGDQQVFEYLDGKATASVDRDGRWIKWLKGGGGSILTLSRDNATDSGLMETMVRELDRRGLDFIDEAGCGVGGSSTAQRQSGQPCDHIDRVVLLSESDTFYGRALPPMFHQAVEGLLKDRSKMRLDPHVDPLGGGWTGIETFSYLKGLDGEVAGSQPRKPNEPGQAGAGSGSGASGSASDGVFGRSTPYDRPDGSRQFDYLRRLAQTLRESEMGGVGDARKIRAIGILGSDVYDKLLLIRALRPEFPGAIFFTTDLDNRLLDHKELPYTRNLVVVSGYGLTLHGQPHAAHPAFRDAYQTAAYASALQALGAIAIDRLGPARIFEVGRRREFDMSPSDRVTGAAGHVTYGGTVTSPLHPAWSPPGWRDMLTIIVILVILVLLGVAHLWPLSSTVRAILSGGGRVSPEKPPAVAGNRAALIAAMDRAGRRKRRWLAVTLVGYVLAVGVVFLSIAASTADGLGERLSVSHGVSLWPTVLFNLTAVGLTAAFLFHGYHVVRQNLLDLSLDYDFSPEVTQRPARLPAASGVAKRIPIAAIGDLFSPTIYEWDEVVDAYIRRPPGEAKGERRLNVPELVQEYNWLLSPKRWLARSAVLSGVFLAIAMVCFTVWGVPSRPHRGATVWWFDRIFAVVAGIGLIYLTFFVADVVRLCEVFCRQLAGKQTPWEYSTLRRLSPHQDTVNDFAEVLDIRLIAKHTEAVQRLVVFPFVILSILGFAHATLWKNHEWSDALIGLLAALALLACVSVVILRRSAERARSRALRNLRTQLADATANEARGGQVGRAEQIRLMIDEIGNNARGAFSPLTQHPLVGALMIPLGGAGTLSLIDLFARG